MIQMPNKEKCQFSFVAYADFESILVPEDNGKQNPHKSYTNKYKKHFSCRYRYILVCVDDEFSKSFNSYLGEDTAYTFINSMIEESKYCSDVTIKHFDKGLVINKEDDEDFENYIKYCICDNVYIDGNVKIRDHRRIIGKSRGFSDRDFNIIKSLLYSAT